MYIVQNHTYWLGIELDYRILLDLDWSRARYASRNRHGEVFEEKERVEPSCSCGLEFPDEKYVSEICRWKWASRRSTGDDTDDKTYFFLMWNWALEFMWNQTTFKFIEFKNCTRTTNWGTMIWTVVVWPGERVAPDNGSPMERACTEARRETTTKRSFISCRIALYYFINPTFKYLRLE